MKTDRLLTGFADEIAPDLTTQMKVMEKLGIFYIEMRGVDGDNLIFHTDAKVKEIKARLDEREMKLSALGSPLGKIGIRDDFEPHFEAFKRAVEIAHMMNTPNIRMFSFYIPEGEKRSSLQGEVFERIGRFTDYAEKNDVVLLHENEKGIYGEQAAECRALMDTFGGKHFKAIFDFANFVQAKQDTLEAYSLLEDHIAYLHVKDALWVNGTVVPAGMGDGNVAEILHRMMQKGYAGFLSLEPHLSDFAGLQQLENGLVRTRVMNKEKLTGEEAFTLAYEALMGILEQEA